MKDQIILAIAGLFKRSNPNLKGKDILDNAAYNDALIDVINSIEAIVIVEEFTMPTAASETELNRTCRFIRECFQVKLSPEAELNIATSINDKCTLMAVKQYKEATGLDLKTCKQDVDAVRHRLGTL